MKKWIAYVIAYITNNAEIDNIIADSAGIANIADVIEDIIAGIADTVADL